MRKARNISVWGGVFFAAFFDLSLIFAYEPPEDSSFLYSKPAESHPLLINLPDIQADPQWVIPLPEWPAEERIEEKTEEGLEIPLSPEPKEDASSPEIPLIQNDSVVQQIHFFQNVYRAPLTKGLARSNQYLAFIKEILMQSNLPLDLAYLPLLESNFGVHAVSRAKAVGLWQFMRATAKRYGLRVDPWIDERRDPVKSTRAAAAYLKDLYRLMGSWPLALASYNAGENRVLRAMAATKTVGFWELKATGKLPLQTQYFVPKYMAITMIAKDPERYGFPSPEYQPPLQYEEVVIHRTLSMDAIARGIGVPLNVIETLNPELRKGTTPPNYPNYRFKLPPNTTEIFMANRSKMEQPHLHRIKRGETLNLIAKRYKVPMKELLKANRLHTRSIIRTGHSLIIPNV